MKVLSKEFTKRFFNNAHQTESYPPSLVEDLCLSHETLRAQVEIYERALNFYSGQENWDLWNVVNGGRTNYVLQDGGFKAIKALREGRKLVEK